MAEVEEEEEEEEEEEREAEVSVGEEADKVGEVEAGVGVVDGVAVTVAVVGEKAREVEADVRVQAEEARAEVEVMVVEAVQAVWTGVKAAEVSMEEVPLVLGVYRVAVVMLGVMEAGVVEGLAELQRGGFPRCLATTPLRFQLHSLSSGRQRKP